MPPSRLYLPLGRPRLTFAQIWAKVSSTGPQVLSASGVQMGANDSNHRLDCGRDWSGLDRVLLLSANSGVLFGTRKDGNVSLDVSPQLFDGRHSRAMHPERTRLPTDTGKQPCVLTERLAECVLCLSICLFAISAPSRQQIPGSRHYLVNPRHNGLALSVSWSHSSMRLCSDCELSCQMDSLSMGTTYRVQ